MADDVQNFSENKQFHAPDDLFMKKSWWKILSVALLTYAILAGLLSEVPRLNIVNESIRGLYFHVPMWFGMITMFLLSFICAIRYLLKPSPLLDIYSVELTHVGVAYGVFGTLTGMVWANYTWGSPWHGDVKQNMSAISMLVYLAYFVLRGSVQNDEQRARLSAVYNIFAFVAMIPLIFIIPRMTSSMHPGSGGNPGFNMYDLHSSMRPVFYSACAGWILLAAWIASVRIRFRIVSEKIAEQNL
jgi:heme exporter protein C